MADADDKSKDTKAAAAPGEGAAASQAPVAKPKAAPSRDTADGEERSVVPLPVTRWQLGEFINNRHSVPPASGTPFEDLLRPEFWANIVRMAAGDIIEVRPEDQSYYAELYVLKRERNAAIVAVIRPPVKLEGAFKLTPGVKAYKVEFSGSHGKWRVVRLSDNTTVRDRFGSEGEARRWLDDYERMLAA